MKVQNKVKPGSNFFAHSLDNLFNEFFNEDLTKPLFRNRPSVNVLESNDDFKIEMTVPGLTKEHIQINIDNDVLTIAGKNEVTTAEGAKYLRREFTHYDFKRTFNLSDTVNQDSVKAAFENGILTVTLAKKEEAKPQPARQIEIA